MKQLLKSEGMMMLKVIALYDETCSLCQMSKNRMMPLDWFNRVNWISLQDFEKKLSLPLINRKELRKELHLITVKGEILKGFYAIRKIMLQCPLLVILGVICYIPFADIFGNKIYRFVAKNRYLFFQNSCDDDKCSF